MNKQIIALLLLLIPGHYLSATDHLAWTSSDFLSKRFIEIGLKNEYSRKPSVIRKWTKPVHYFFVHQVADVALHERLSRLHLQQLSAITEIKFIPVSEQKKADLLIIFSAEDQLKQLLRDTLAINSATERQQLFKNSVCLARFSVNQDASIQRAIVVIPVDRARSHAKLVACVVEEITQIMGLPNDVETIFPSIFNDQSKDELLTGLDYLLLKILYHPLLKVGTTEQQIKPILRKIIQSLASQGEIDQAEKKVRQAGLYSLVYGL